MRSNQNQSKSFLSVLDVLKLARSKLINDFLEREPAIFVPMFKYENDMALMNLALERYFVSWINLHFQLWHNHSKCAKSNKIFLKTMKTLLEKYSSDLKKCEFSDDRFIFNLLN